MSTDLRLAAGWISQSRSITVLTGAGVSAESGVPTFRGEKGLWRRHRPEELATPEAFQRNPELVWEWYRYRQVIVAGADPNAAHIALAEMERGRDRFSLITQNVDGLHRRAGSIEVVELHGNLFRARCPIDGYICELSAGEDDKAIPTCPDGHMMRPDIVWFGESLPIEAVRHAHESAVSCDLFLTIGTSAVVQPAASLPLLAKHSGARLIEVNPEETPITSQADISLSGPAAEIVPLLIEEA